MSQTLAYTIMIDKENVTEKSFICCQAVLTWSIALISSPAASVWSPCAPVARRGGGWVWRARFRCRGGGGAWTRGLCIICRRRSQICRNNKNELYSNWQMQSMTTEHGRYEWERDVKSCGFHLKSLRNRKKISLTISLTKATDNKVIMFHAAVLYLSSRRQCRGTLVGNPSTSRGIAWEDVS